MQTKLNKLTFFYKKERARLRIPKKNSNFAGFLLWAIEFTNKTIN